MTGAVLLLPYTPAYRGQGQIYIFNLYKFNVWDHLSISPEYDFVPYQVQASSRLTWFN